MPSTARTHQLDLSLLYHIMNRGNARLEIFHNQEDYLYFIGILQNYYQEYHFFIYHWVLMPNHYHLLLELQEPKKLSKIMAGINRSYVHYHHKTYQSAGHLFQGRFKSKPIEKEKYLLSCGRYIERNPVKAGFAQYAEDYPYSSSRFYVFGKPDHLTTKDPLIETFGEDPKQHTQAYRDFLRKFDAEEERQFESFEMPLGSREFRHRLTKEKGLFLPRKRGRPKELIYL